MSSDPADRSPSVSSASVGQGAEPDPLDVCAPSAGASSAGAPSAGAPSAGAPSGEAASEQGHARVVRAAGWVGILTLASRILGMARDMVIAALFSKTVTDAFFVAFTIPNVLRRLLAEGTLTVAFIPVFTDYRDNQGEAEARRFLDAAWTRLVWVLLGVCLAGVLAAPLLVRLFAWGFADEPAKLALAVRLTQVMFPYLFFVSLMALSMGVLNTLGHFTAPAVAPVLLNVMMIGCTAALWKPLEAAGYPPIYGLGIGVLAGGAVQLGLQLPVMARRGYFPRLRPRLHHPGVRRMLRLMAPAVFGLALYQVNVMLSRLLASFLPDGSVTYLYYAQRLIEFPMGIFAVAVATAAMPRLSKQAAAGAVEDLKRTYADSTRLTLFIILPAMVGLLVLGGPILAVLFERGRFTPAMTLATNEALAAFAISLWAAAGIRITVPVYFALEDSRTPVRIAAVALGVYLAAGLTLMWPLKHVGLALAISLSSMTNFLLLLLLLRRRIGPLGLRRVVASGLRALAASAVMGGVAWGLWHLLAAGAVGWRRAGLLLGVVAVAAACYLAVAVVLRSPEIGEVMGAVRRRR